MTIAGGGTYHARFDRVLRHIDEHLEDELSVEALSEIAAFSKFHFHRQFSGLFRVNVHRYVQLTRLKRASYRLAFRDSAIITIALESGYEGPEAFSRAFKQHLGQTPSAFRKRPQWTPWLATYRPLSEARTMQTRRTLQDQPVEIIHFKGRRVAMLQHRGDPALIGDSIRKFIDWRKQAGLPPRLSETFNILYDNPAETRPEAFRLDICAATDRALAPNDAGIVEGHIPAGRCAVFRHIGSGDGLGEAASYLYSDWLPRSGEEPREFPLFCQRVRFFPDVPEHEAVTDLFLPLR